MDENKRKTLANCKLSEFTAHANKIRKQVYEYYHILNVQELAKKYSEIYKDSDTEEKKSLTNELLSDVFDAMMTEHPIETVELIASFAFMTFEEAEELTPTEALEIVLECALSQKVIDFFINVERLAGNGTDSILPALIFLKAFILEMSSSGSESQNSTKDTKENALAGDMSESA